MLLISILLFTVAAFLGIYLLTFVLQHKETPKGVAFTHGPLASIGLILLIIYALKYQPAPISSIIIFILAAMGGTVLILRDLTGKPLPKWLAIGHGLIAAVGFILLLKFAFSP
jgi:hypothetical protein